MSTENKNTEQPVEVIDQAYFDRFANPGLLLKCFEVVKDAIEFVDDEGVIRREDDTYFSFYEAYWALKVLFQRETGADAKEVADKRIANLRAALYSGKPPEPIILPEIKVERLVLLEEPYFHQFDNLTLAAMAYNDTDEAQIGFSESAHTKIDEDTAWNISVGMINASTALRLLVTRLSGGSLESMRDIVALISNPNGETLQ